MPNGRPGDHPYTDIVVHGSSSEFGEEISGLVRAMAAAPGFAAVREEVVDLIESIPLASGPDDRDAAMAALLSRLREIEARLARRDFGPA